MRTGLLDFKVVDKFINKKKFRIFIANDGE